jgi:heme/copper-type cytochrome/quinol oxidase subunit 2
MYSGILSVPPTTGTFDSLLNWYLFFGIGAAIIVITLLVVFSVRYRYRGEKTPMPKHKVEGWKIVLITVIISVSILTFAEYQTFSSFGNIEIPNNTTCIQNTGFPCVNINVMAFQWGWNYTYPNGRFMVGNLTVPAGMDVVINLSSRDVFHSMGITMLAQKEDAVPGRTNQMWFSLPTEKVGTTPDVAAVTCNAAGTSCSYIDAIRCFELCGVGHATMWANLTVVSQATWDAWIGGSGT